MSTTISVSKQSVAIFFRTAVQAKFVIPDYQRPYAWTVDQAETLFEDLWNFAGDTIAKKFDATGLDSQHDCYFLGSIVFYINNHNEQEIIDGQQRITSLFLLLRAIYTKLQTIIETSKNSTAEHFSKQIEPFLWYIDPRNGQIHHKQHLLISRVITDAGNEIFNSILENGYADAKATDNYSQNYRCFQKLFDKHSQDNPLLVYDFIYCVLECAIMLPIAADNQDTALTIFSTLNDRGLPLSDSDIFKAKIYNHLNQNEVAQKLFIESWQDLEKESSDVNESIQQLFYYNMFYARAKKHDTSVTTPGLRKYYTSEPSDLLYNPTLIDTLFKILNIWKVVNNHEEIKIVKDSEEQAYEAWSKNIRIKQNLDILHSYPNEFWKYPVIVYYLCHYNNENFEVKFMLFLQKLITELITKYLIKPTANAVKRSILKLNAEIVNSDTPKFEFKNIDIQDLYPYLKIPNRNVLYMLLKILAYGHKNQDQLLPEKWEVEHIFPCKWQNTYFPNEKDTTVREAIEHIGNKIPFEKKLNIITGNNYFKKKKDKYKVSKIAITNELGNSDINDWSIDSIINRDEIVITEIISMLNRWNTEYNQNNTEQ